MEEKHFNRLYDLDEDRLYSNFERIQNIYKNLNLIEIISKFLFSRSIGNSVEEVSKVLSYYKKNLFRDNLLLDFAFEWIRAQKIRLEYKKYFNLTSYKAYTIALDDVIFLFFLRYDEYLRPLFKNNMDEYEFSALYQILFNPKQSNPINLVSHLEKNKKKVPTIIFDGEKVNTKILTLREGLSEMIKGDFNEGLPSKIEILEQKKQRLNETSTPEKNFDGTTVERLIKFYCFQNIKIDKKEFNLAITQFLSSYFQFNLFYNFHEFKEKLVSSFAEYIFSGLTKKYESYSIEILQNEINSILDVFEKSMKQEKLMGNAWIEDLKPILQDFIEKFVDHL